MALIRESMTRGDEQLFTATFKREDGSVYNIKNWVVFFTLKKDWAIPDANASLQKIITAFDDTTSGTSGSANISLAHADTVNLEPGEYDWDISVITPTGGPYTIIKGKLDLEYDVTFTKGTAGTA